MHTPKSEWPKGEWTEEPDEKRWEDEATGLQCFVTRGPVGAWCGYVGVRAGHPAYGLSYYKSDFDLKDVISGKAMREVRVQHQINEIKVHGGLTYAGSDEFRGEEWHWFGFDCSHAGDWSPGVDSLAELGRPTGWGTVETYRNLAYAMEQCMELARQLGAIDPNKEPEQE